MPLVKPIFEGKGSDYKDIGDYFTKHEVMTYFRISEATYMRWRKKGLLMGVRRGSNYFYHARDIANLIDKFKEY